MGSFMPTVTGPCFIDKEDDVVIATDGTVKNGMGGAAYSLHTTETPGLIWSVLPVDGRPTQIRSYCAELFGMLGALLLLHQQLEDQNRCWEQLTAVLWCNNEAAVNRFNVLEGH